MPASARRRSSSGPSHQRSPACRSAGPGTMIWISHPPLGRLHQQLQELLVGREVGGRDRGCSSAAAIRTRKRYPTSDHTTLDCPRTTCTGLSPAGSGTRWPAARLEQGRRSRPSCAGTPPAVPITAGPVQAEWVSRHSSGSRASPSHSAAMPDPAGEPDPVVAHEDLAVRAVLHRAEAQPGEGRPEIADVAPGPLHHVDQMVASIERAPMASSSTRTRTPRRAAALQRCRHATGDVTGPVHERQHLDPCARPRRWPRHAGKISSPLRSSSTRLPAIGGVPSAVVTMSAITASLSKWAWAIFGKKSPVWGDHSPDRDKRPCQPKRFSHASS